jgi:hypothetical protein
MIMALMTVEFLHLRSWQASPFSYGKSLSFGISKEREH